MKIWEIKENKKQFLSLLLLADEQENMIDRYLERGTMYVLNDNGVKAASSLYKLTRIHLVKKERFDEFMKHIYKVPGTNKQIIKKFARIGEASIIYSIGRHRFIELARAAGATYKINEGTGGTVLVNLEIFDNYMEQFRQPVRPLKEPLYGQEEGELNE